MINDPGCLWRRYAGTSARPRGACTPSLLSSAINPAARLRCGLQDDPAEPSPPRRPRCNLQARCNALRVRTTIRRASACIRVQAGRLCRGHGAACRRPELIHGGHLPHADNFTIGIGAVRMRFAARIAVSHTGVHHPDSDGTGPHARVAQSSWPRFLASPPCVGLRGTVRYFRVRADRRSHCPIARRAPSTPRSS